MKCGSEIKINDVNQRNLNDKRQVAGIEIKMRDYNEKKWPEIKDIDVKRKLHKKWKQ